MQVQETKRLNIQITGELHKEMKVAAAQEGITISQYVAEAIADRVERDKQKG